MARGRRVGAERVVPREVVAERLWPEGWPLTGVAN